MKIVPISTTDANAFVRQFHRHNGETGISGTVAVGLESDGLLVGVGIGGRPISRALDNGLTFEVRRVCTLSNAPKGAVSKLYSAMRRLAYTLGYQRCITYTLTSESGSSLRGAGWIQEEFLEARGGWDCPSRPRKPTKADGLEKIRWTVKSMNQKSEKGEK